MGRLESTSKNSFRRKNRVRTQVRGTTLRPRLSVNVSNLHISAQIIDDQQHITIVGCSSANKKLSGTMSEKAQAIGSEIAKLAKSKKVTKVAFDRGDRKYHGRIKALAEAARKGGLEF